MDDDDSYVEIPSHFAFTSTLDRLIMAIEHAGMTVFGRIDHAAGARLAGMDMPPTIVLTYGNPRGGTPMMLASPRAALDLPLRVLIREDVNAITMVAFAPITAVLRRAGVPIDLAARLEPAQSLLIEAIKPTAAGAR